MVCVIHSHASLVQCCFLCFFHQFRGFRPQLYSCFSLFFLFYIFLIIFNHLLWNAPLTFLIFSLDNARFNLYLHGPDTHYCRVSNINLYMYSVRWRRQCIYHHEFMIMRTNINIKWWILVIKWMALLYSILWLSNKLSKTRIFCGWIYNVSLPLRMRPSLCHILAVSRQWLDSTFKG